MDQKSRFPANPKVICFECLTKAVGRYVDSLTWFFDGCPDCQALRICTKREFILEFKGKKDALQMSGDNRRSVPPTGNGGEEADGATKNPLSVVRERAPQTNADEKVSSQRSSPLDRPI